MTNSAVSAVAPILKHQITDPLFTPIQAAEFLGISTNTLAVWRCTQRYDLPFVKCGRLIRYRKSSLEAFVNNRTHGAEV